MIIDLASMLQDISGSNNVLYNIITGVPAISNTSSAYSEDMGFAPLQENPGDDDTISQLSDGESYQKERAPPLFEPYPIYEYKKGEPEPILKNSDESETIAEMTEEYIKSPDKTERNDGKNGPTERVDNNNT